MFLKFIAWFFYFILSCFVQMIGICEQKIAFLYIYIILLFLLYIPPLLLRIEGTFHMLIYNLAKILAPTLFIACLFNMDFFISFEIILFGVCIIE